MSESDIEKKEGREINGEREHSQLEKEREERNAIEREGEKEIETN